MCEDLRKYSGHGLARSQNARSRVGVRRCGMAKKPKELKPLRRFDYSLISAPLDGLLFNVDRDLEKRHRWAFEHKDLERESESGLLLVLLRFAKNSYNAVRFLTATEPPDAARKSTYTLILPPVNRQLLDLLFSLVYMLEDLGPRSLAYQKSGWRELVEERQTVSSSFAKDPTYRDYFRNLNLQIERLAELLRISPEEKKDPKQIPFWPTPTNLVDVPGSSRNFRRHLMKWIYSDVSSQSHLGFGGLQKMASFLVADLMGDSAALKEGRDRAAQSYHFQQVSRAASVMLAIATEIDTYLQLGNGTQADYLWIILGEHVPEAQEWWEKRYSGRQASPPA